MTSSDVVHVDFGAREATLKLVYYGPTGSGKTANLVTLHSLASPESRGRMMTIETGEDRTLFFDLVAPTSLPADAPLHLRIKLFAVPAQPLHVATRRLVLQGADGVAFIADSQSSETENNAASFMELCDNLKAGGTDIGKVPLVIQFNKRDLPDVRSDQELGAIAARGKEPVFFAVAKEGEGVLETFLGLLHLTWATLEETCDLESRLGIRGPEILRAVALQLQTLGPVDSLLAKSMGGSYRPVGHLEP